MSSQRKPPQPAPGPKPGGKPGAKPGPAPERKGGGAKGPIITPQVLGIALFLILIIAISVYWKSVVVSSNTKMQELSSQIASSNANIATYNKKIARLAGAKEVDVALRAKLGKLDHLFLSDQTSLMPFFEHDLLPILDSSRLQGWVVKVQEFTYEINMAMSPFDTLPTHFIKDPRSVFKMKYIGEANGKAPDGPRDTRPTTFLKPYTITVEECTGTYEEMQDFIKHLQQNNKIKLVTIHCVKNDEGKNVRYFRTSSTWKMMATIYFMNPDAAAVGNDPPEAPGSKTCS
jgi:hypothetical protein